ncbi:MAG TPA: hypothetical protein VJ981_06070 [Gammaproteobacteria bacterium]|nr:hypothetical protein [Gammaproteobacteria bacterium]
MIKKVYSDNELLAIIIPGDYRRDGIEFFTENSFSQQLGYMNRKAGYLIEPHVHNEVKREVDKTQEVLLIRSGTVRVDLYNRDRKYIQSRMLKAGDVILLASGGHGFEMVEDTEIIEIKQGPYAGDDDKSHFTGIAGNRVNIVDD